MPTQSDCLATDKPWQLRYAAAVVAILGFGAFAFGLGVNPVAFRLQAIFFVLQTIFFVLLFGIILLPLFEVWWRDCKPTQRSTRT